eukprot:CAMPEP_0117420938 /NCGR_PEP_ID=MMETSP0758-20121206/2165_1 /TAXON_ID=63605 /ORGANISM="Percolomonas cosmopolitus, Strain AE-1 (ATCC 50343)" /LENGTH=295 /DNA_ID=CAMNT_0005202833 /DNA_START=829 /DNA_END=1713 /DNA_ORIENTATION=-
MTYLWISAIQIRFGFPKTYPKELLITNTDIISRAFYGLYRILPFVYELRLILDWTFTKTALDYQAWMVLEDIRTVLYNRRIYLAQISKKKAGASQDFLTKLIWGFLFFLALFIVLLFPLIFFSNINPALEYNTISDIKVTIGFKGWDPLYTNRWYYLKPESSRRPWAPYATYMDDVRKFQEFDPNVDFQYLNVTPYSNEFITFSPPARLALIDSLMHAKPELELLYQITRKSPESILKVENSVALSLSDSQQQQIIEMLRQVSNPPVIVLNQAYNPLFINAEKQIIETSYPEIYW